MMEKTNLADYKSLPTSPGIYYILNNQNGNFYVGSAKNLRKRIGAHCNNDNSNPHLQYAINKYGIDSFTVRVEIYDTLSSYEELFG